MPTLSEQQLKTIREQLAHFEELTQGDWQAMNEKHAKIIFNHIKCLPTKKERFNYYNKFKIKADCFYVAVEVLDCGFEPDYSNKSLSDFILTQIDYSLCNFKTIHLLQPPNLLRNQTGDMMSYEND